jgi:hypothetical protein
MRSIRAKRIFCLLAALLNLGGGPMAWAHLAGTGSCHEAEASTAAQDSSDCPEHQASKPADDPRPTAPASLPCCDGGNCVCAAPPSIATCTVIPSPQLRGIALNTEVRLDAAPSTFIDDALRPPIY